VAVSNPFNGSIDDVRVYSEAKSADWVKQYYDNTKGLY